MRRDERSGYDRNLVGGGSSKGDTIEEVVVNFRDAIQDQIELLEADGLAGMFVMI